MKTFEITGDVLKALPKMLLDNNVTGNSNVEDDDGMPYIDYRVKLFKANGGFRYGKMVIHYNYNPRPEDFPLSYIHLDGDCDLYSSYHNDKNPSADLADRLIKNGYIRMQVAFL